MKTFTDNAGRSWTVTINVSAIKRVRDLVGVDLLEIVEGALIEKLIRDPVLLCDVLYAVCKPQADESDVSDEEFGRAMFGDAIELATKALLEDLVGFFPSPRDRANLQKVIEMAWKTMERARDVIDQRIANGELDKIAQQALANAGISSGAALEFSASTPDR